MKKRYQDIAIVSIAGIFILAMLIFCLSFWSKEAQSESVYPGPDFREENYSKGFESEIAAAAARYGLPPALVKAVIRQESGFVPGRRGKKGEIGLMQLMPSHLPGASGEWARIHRSRPFTDAELFEVNRNLDIGCWYLARALKRWQKYKEHVALALVEYNAGPSRAGEFKPEKPDGEVIPLIKIPGTRKYVQNVLAFYREYQAKSAEK